MEYMAILLFVCVCIVLMAGYPVAYSLAGTALLFAGVGTTGQFDDSYLLAMPSRLFGIISNQTLLAVPLCVYGSVLEKSKVAEELPGAMEQLFGGMKGGLAIAGDYCRYATGCKYRNCWCDSCHYGLLSLPAMLNAGMTQPSRQVPSVPLGLGTNYSSFHCPRVVGRCYVSAYQRRSYPGSICPTPYQWVTFLLALSFPDCYSSSCISLIFCWSVF